MFKKVEFTIAVYNKEIQLGITAYLGRSSTSEKFRNK
jgi:hypothetical protein